MNQNQQKQGNQNQNQEIYPMKEFLGEKNMLAMNSELANKSTFGLNNHQYGYLMKDFYRSPYEQTHNQRENTKFAKEKDEQVFDSRKIISDEEGESEQENGSSLQNQKFRQKKGKRVKKRRFVKGNTNNLLINFRGFFIKFLETINRKSKYSHLVRRIKAKKTMTLNDYVVLFKSSYREEIGEIFKTRYLQRAILMSRISPKLKPLYLKKIEVFQQAYNLELFPKIK